MQCKEKQQLYERKEYIISEKKIIANIERQNMIGKHLRVVRLLGGPPPQSQPSSFLSVFVANVYYPSKM